MKKILHNINGLRSLGVVLFVCLMAISSFAQKQVIGTFPAMEGSFENQPAAALASVTTIATATATTAWTGSSATLGSIKTDGTARVGSNHMSITSGTGSTKRFQSPSVTATTPFSVSTQYTVQYYYRVATTTTAVMQIGVGVNGTGAPIYFPSAAPYVSLSATSGAWVKYAAQATTTATVPDNAGIGIIRIANVANGLNGTQVDVDDFVVYAGAVDNTAPDAPTVPTSKSTSLTANNISWTAPVTGVDGGGYIVVRGTTDPTTAPIANGIYSIGNTVDVGQTVAYIGTGTSFTDAGLTTGVTYFYRVYTCDKAFNYSTAVTAVSETAGLNKAIVTGNWNSTSTWSLSSVPSATDNVSIPTGLTIGVDVAATCNNLTLAGGLLTLGANDLTVNGTISGGSITSHIVTDAAGALVRPVTAATATTFPIGISAGSYDPLTVTPTNGVTFNASVKSAFTNVVADPTKTCAREWNIAATGAGSTAMSFTEDASITPPTGTDVIGHYGAAWSESDITGVSRAGNTYSGTNASGTFSPFGGGVAGGFAAVLAVELTNFSAKSNGNTNLLAWKTANEKNNKEFQIERSANGSQFTSIGTVKGNGTTASASSYTFLDETPLSISYYRLVSVDNNDKKETSNVVTVLRGANGKTKLFPTLVADKMTIVSDSNEPQSFNIFDLTGRNVQKGTFTTQQDVFVSGLATGTYLLKVGNDVVKFIKQ
jgi:hypothetical protein